MTVQGLHVIQDRFAHMQNASSEAKNINSHARKKYPDATKIPEDLKKYYEAHSGKIDKDDDRLAAYVLADNPHAEYLPVGKHGDWKYHSLKENNPRYKNARKASKKYLEDFFKSAR